jgi:hypothetical protein
LVAATLTVSTVSGCSPGKDLPRPEVMADSVRAAGSIRDAARELGREPFEADGAPSQASIDGFLDVLGRSPALFGGPVLGQNATDEGKVTPLVAAGMNMAVAELLKLLPGGVQFPDADAEKSVENLDDRAVEKRLRRLKQHDLKVYFGDAVRTLAVLALFSEENLARQVVPPGSEVSTALSDKGFVGPDGRVRVPAPPVFPAIANTRWNVFADALESVKALSDVLYRAIDRGYF